MRPGPEQVEQMKKRTHFQNHRACDTLRGRSCTEMKQKQPFIFSVCSVSFVVNRFVGSPPEQSQTKPTRNLTGEAGMGKCPTLTHAPVTEQSHPRLSGVGNRLTSTSSVESRLAVRLRGDAAKPRAVDLAGRRGGRRGESGGAGGVGGRVGRENFAQTAAARGITLRREVAGVFGKHGGKIKRRGGPAR
jgi:hypothetical protein